MINKKELIKQIIILFLVIIGSAVFVRVMLGGETLLDYASENNIPIHAEKTDEYDTGSEEETENDTDDTETENVSEKNEQNSAGN